MKPWFQLLKCSWFPICIWSFCSSVWSAPSPTACIVAHTSSRMLMIPGGFWWDQDSKAPVQRQLKAPVQWLIRSFLKQGNSSPDSRYHLESQSFPLTKNAINNPIWELPLRPNDGGKSIFQKKKKKKGLTSLKFYPNSYVDHYLLTPICTKMLLKTQKKNENILLDPNSFLNVRFSPVTHRGMVHTVRADTFSHVLFFSHSTIL